MEFSAPAVSADQYISSAFQTETPDILSGVKRSLSLLYSSCILERKTWALTAALTLDTMMQSQIWPNRGPVASTSGRGVAQNNTCFNLQRQSPPLAGSEMPHARRYQNIKVAATSSKTRESTGWETVWVNDNGTEILLDEEEDIPDEIDEAELASPKKGPSKRLPAEMKYFDTAGIYLKAGDGGNGCIAFRREKFVPRGGPAGGNGGDGGHVWAVVDLGLNSLSTFRRQLHFRGSPGTGGGGSGKHGACGSDVEVRVPRGTIVRKRDAPEGAPALAELLKEGQRVLLAAGGRGGRGNAAFKTGSNNAPQLAESGAPGQEMWVDLELRLVADVGIIGVPNAGKSTLLSVVSAAKPKIANYPFTTLVPNLGVCELDFQTTVFADVPGILEGAHLGIGLGHEFLRHCQRSKVLVHIIDGTSPDPIGDYQAICTELELFNPELAGKPQVVAYNKMDVPDSSDYWEDIQEELLERGIQKDDILPISAVTGEGVIDLVRRLRAVLDALPPIDDTVPTVDALNLAAPSREIDRKRIDEFTITTDHSQGRYFFVEGDAVLRFAQMTNWSYYESLVRFQKVLELSGIDKALRQKGVKEGDTVVFGDLELEWSDDQSEGALYGRWLEDVKSQGRALKGSARWPHAG